MQLVTLPLDVLTTIAPYLRVPEIIRFSSLSKIIETDFNFVMKATLEIRKRDYHSTLKTPDDALDALCTAVALKKFCGKIEQPLLKKAFDELLEKGSLTQTLRAAKILQKVNPSIYNEFLLRLSTKYFRMHLDFTSFFTQIQELEGAESLSSVTNDFLYRVLFRYMTRQHSPDVSLLSFLFKLPSSPEKQEAIINYMNLFVRRGQFQSRLFSSMFEEDERLRTHCQFILKKNNLSSGLFGSSEETNTLFKKFAEFDEWKKSHPSEEEIALYASELQFIDPIFTIFILQSQIPHKKEEKVEILLQLIPNLIKSDCYDYIHLNLALDIFHTVDETDMKENFLCEIIEKNLRIGDYDLALNVLRYCSFATPKAAELRIIFAINLLIENRISDIPLALGHYLDWLHRQLQVGGDSYTKDTLASLALMESIPQTHPLRVDVQRLIDLSTHLRLNDQGRKLYRQEIRNLIRMYKDFKQNPLLESQTQGLLEDYRRVLHHNNPESRTQRIPILNSIVVLLQGMKN